MSNQFSSLQISPTDYEAHVGHQSTSPFLSTPYKFTEPRPQDASKPTIPFQGFGDAAEVCNGTDLVPFSLFDSMLFMHYLLYKDEGWDTGYLVSDVFKDDLKAEKDVELLVVPHDQRDEYKASREGK